MELFAIAWFILVLIGIIRFVCSFYIRNGFIVKSGPAPPIYKPPSVKAPYWGVQLVVIRK